VIARAPGEGSARPDHERLQEIRRLYNTEARRLAGLGPVQGDVPPEITKLKQQDGKNLLVIGSGTLVQTLLRHDLVDELLLATHPLILGGGKRLFREEYHWRTFELADSKPTTKGVLVARYRATS
jgi:dihydrofolate reductase